MQNNWDIAVTHGSLDGCSKVFEMIIEENDPILLQSPTYTGVIGAVRSFKIISQKSNKF